MEGRLILMYPSDDFEAPCHAPVTTPYARTFNFRFQTLSVVPSASVLTQSFLFSKS